MPGRGTLEKEKPPILVMIQRGGAVVIQMLENIQQATIRPLIKRYIAPGTQVYTDEYDIYTWLLEWGFDHQTDSQGEYARNTDGDGFHEVHVNTAEGFWSLLRSWVRPHRGISRKKNCRSTWASSSSCITSAFEVKACSDPFWNCW